MSEDKKKIEIQYQWEPWILFKSDTEVLPIDEPPCKFCHNWKPVKNFDSSGNFSGLTLCHAETQFKDFSCYKGMF
jgi:hypothetical protein